MLDYSTDGMLQEIFGFDDSDDKEHVGVECQLHDSHHIKKLLSCHVNNDKHIKINTWNLRPHTALYLVQKYACRWPFFIARASPVLNIVHISDNWKLGKSGIDRVKVHLNTQEIEKKVL